MTNPNTKLATDFIVVVLPTIGTTPLTAFAYKPEKSINSDNKSIRWQGREN